MERKGKAVAQLIKVTTKRQDFGKDFQYVVQRRSKARICFGTTQARQNGAKTSRLAVKHYMEINDSLYPGKYWTRCELIIKKPLSTRGTVLGGRTAAQYPPTPDSQGPPPNKYRLPSPSWTNIHTFTGPERLRCRTKEGAVGPGYYPQTKNKDQIFAYSFGGPKKLIPAVEMKCRPINTDLCDKCKKTPIGDYWTMKPQLTWEEAKVGENIDTNPKYLCRECYQKERKRPNMLRNADFLRYRKIRGCLQVHRHDGCEAKLFLVPPNDIAKIQVKETYLAQYFM